MEFGTVRSSRGDATADYLRRARRVRARLSHDPAKMHRELKRLSCAESVDARATVRRVVSRLPEAFPLRSHPAVAEAFAAEVERSLESGVLRYSVRARLLREARQRGLGRFEANLIIAAVQHRRSMQPLGIKGFGYATDDARAHWWQPVATFLLAQGLILLTAWWVLLR